LTRIERFLPREKGRFFEEWMEFLRFQSISADPAFSESCEACCSWVARHLEALGFTVEIIRGEGKPIVFAERAGDSTKKGVIFYGHYDVQPVDPLNLWKTPPFEPQIRDGRMYARGAQDNKGQLFYVLKAIETLIKENELSCPLKVIIEGEEGDRERSSCGASSEDKRSPRL
jgi:acetylornithine deacetylase/succinyl-diaminopimelate desuccinylase-like protein